MSERGVAEQEISSEVELSKADYQLTQLRHFPFLIYIKKNNFFSLLTLLVIDYQLLSTFYIEKIFFKYNSNVLIIIN